MSKNYSRSIGETLWSEIKKYHGAKRVRPCVLARIMKLNRYTVIARNYPLPK